MKKYLFGSLFFACLAMCFADVASAQPGLERPGSRGRANDLMGLLRNESVKAELELIDDQKEEIDSIMETMWSEMREKMSQNRDMRDLSPEERRQRYAELREEMDERRQKYMEQISEVLLPNQLARLKQLGIQSSSRRYGTGAIAVLFNKDFLDELGIDEETQEKLKKKTEEVLKELEQEVSKLRKKAEEEILSVLPSDVKKKFRESVGDSFDFSGGRGQFGLDGRANGFQGRRGREGRQEPSDK